ncbi:4-fold beta flower protein [Cohnella sp.]|uniref:4-fold beta flower protein n=1 Tax=Cohnella sp. TaxID=1883426 RepID=UPI003563D8E2
MLQPLFDRYCNHVAYIDNGRFLFDTEMNWVAFVHNKQAWSKDNLQWLGPINGIVCMDKEGKVITWGIGQSIMGDLSLHRKPKIVPELPQKPTSPMRPMLQSPPFPRTPLSGWSNLSFDNWIKG